MSNDRALIMSDTFFNKLATTATKGRDSFLMQHLGMKGAINFENFVYASASNYSEDYNGGNWHFAKLTNGAIFMHPCKSDTFHVVNENNYTSGDVDGRIYGLAISLLALSHLSCAVYNSDQKLSSLLGDMYYNLKESFFDTCKHFTSLYQSEDETKQPSTDEVIMLQSVQSVQSIERFMYRFLD